MQCTDQRGMAVIVAILVVAIVAVIATALLTRQAASLRMLRGEQLRTQVRMAVDVALERASLQLREDARMQLTTVAGGHWAEPILLSQPLPTRLQLRDAQGLFNLRNMADGGARDAQATYAFLRLCTGAGAAQEQCEGAAEYVVNRFRDGTLQPQAPLQQDGLLAAALPAVDPAVVALLQQRVMALPAKTLVNANTSDIAVLQACAPTVEGARLTALLAERDRGRWLLNRGDIANRLQLTDAQMAGLPLGIHSEWFLAAGQVHTDAASVPFRALIWREYRDEGVRVQRVWTRIGA